MKEILHPNALQLAQADEASAQGSSTSPMVFTNKPESLVNPFTATPSNSCPPNSCYLIWCSYLEPDEEDEDEYIDSYEHFYLTASSKAEAVRSQISQLTGQGYFIDGSKKQTSDCANLTDAWTEVEITAYGVDDPKFWEYAAWGDDYTQTALAHWATDNPEIAQQVLAKAVGGSTEGHQAVASNGVLRSVCEKRTLSGLAKSCTRKKSAKAKAL